MKGENVRGEFKGNSGGQLFNEIYGTYYNTMAVVIEAARKGELDSDRLYEIVRENSFSESVIPITDAIREERWQLVKSDYRTNIRNRPEMPLTNLQRRFLKSMILDRRAKMFFTDEENLELQNDLKDVEPLFNPDDIVYYDRSAGRDDCPDSSCRQMLRDSMRKNRGDSFQIEYSARDDKFNFCEDGSDVLCKEKKEVVLEITDERNALERISFNFSYLKKSCEKIGENRYLMTLAVDESDREDIVTRVLQFGPYVKALGPDCFVERIKERLRMQKALA